MCRVPPTAPGTTQACRWQVHCVAPDPHPASQQRHSSSDRYSLYDLPDFHLARLGQAVGPEAIMWLTPLSPVYNLSHSAQISYFKKAVLSE